MNLSHARVSESTWTVPVVALLLVGMLVAFYSVVSDATKAGEMRRQTQAARAAAVVRCDALPGWNLSKACRSELDLQVAADTPIALATR